MDKRQRFTQMATDAGFEVRKHFVDASRPLRRGCVLERNNGVSDTFSFTVTEAMFDGADAFFQPPTAAELLECAHA